MTAPIAYTVLPKNPGAHLLEVTLRIAEPDPAGQVLAMPAWIPGSYLVRDFARHVVAIRAECDDEEVTLTKTDKSTWVAAPCESALVVTASIYAYDLSVRGAHFDTTHAYFNGTCVFLRVDGQDQKTCEVEILPPPAPVGHDWRVATSMRRKEAEQYGFGVYEADSYDELIDHPVEIGQLAIGEFEAAGIPHSIAIKGPGKVDMGRVCSDLSTLCAAHHQLLGTPANFDRYIFLLTVLGSGYGGLEHKWSTSLVASREDLPRRDQEGISDGYRKFLGLCSHEYFHLWNVKRMKPAVFSPYELDAESYTGLLWVFEGITSYYDDLVLLRSGLITTESYLGLLGATITRVLRGAGRHLQSVEESSFDAWTKFYKQEANAGNAIVSYYTKGSLIALALDLTLRSQSEGRCSLDLVMQECWSRYGETGVGMPERGLESIAAEVSGLELSDFFERYVRGTADLPLDQLLADVGIKFALRPAQSNSDSGGKRGSPAKSSKTWLGATIINRNGKDLISSVVSGSPAEKAGLAAGDTTVALDNLRLTCANSATRLSEHHSGDEVIVSVFRQDELLRFPVILEPPPEDTCYLEIDTDCSSEREAHRASWLGLQ